MPLAMFLLKVCPEDIRIQMSSCPAEHNIGAWLMVVGGAYAAWWDYGR